MRKENLRIMSTLENLRKRLHRLRIDGVNHICDVCGFYEGHCMYFSQFEQFLMEMIEEENNIKNRKKI